jgi:hypothetical protein
MLKAFGPHAAGTQNERDIGPARTRNVASSYHFQLLRCLAQRSTGVILTDNICDYSRGAEYSMHNFHSSLRQK